MSEPSSHLERDRAAAGESAAERFERSLLIGYEQWHDGTGYDVDALRELTAEQRCRFEARLTPPDGWRDVEALSVLASLGSESARAELRRLASSGSSEIRLAVLRYTPELVDDAARTASLVEALDTATVFDGFTTTLDEVEAFHPKPVIDALWRGLETRQGDVAAHYAAMLAFIHGIADSKFDWSLRPLFLEFNATDAAARRAAIAKLRKRIG
ncbi:MAG: hypothetical protein ACJ79A_20975 [Gemmatimonadaceae bacterium]